MHDQPPHISLLLQVDLLRVTFFPGRASSPLHFLDSRGHQSRKSSCRAYQIHLVVSHVCSLSLSLFTRPFFSLYAPISLSSCTGSPSDRTSLSLFIGREGESYMPLLSFSSTCRCVLIFFLRLPKEHTPLLAFFPFLIKTTSF